MSPTVPALALCAALLTLGANAQGGGPDNQQGGPNTSLAMIILYAITGCVSALFCVVIVSGAIRAIRHPERYGPRTGDPSLGGGSAQSRARGLTRAILDTFPVVKFGTELPVDGVARPKDVENPEEQSYEMEAAGEGSIEGDRRSGRGDGSESKSDEGRGEGEDADEEAKEAETEDRSPGAASSKTTDAAPAVRPRQRRGRSEGEPSGDAAAEGTNADGRREVVPDAIGRETCPICIVDFEEGDDLRVLPCEGHHRFHRECVDQWLLELSSSCPICRQDFHALEAMMAGDNDQLEPPHMPEASRPLSTAAARFSRYLRSARRRHHNRREDGRGYDITDPPMPLASDTWL